MTFLHTHNGGRIIAECEKAFVKYHNDNNKAFDIINCDDSYSRTYQDFLEYFKEKKGGYFIANRDSIAAAIVNAAIERGLKVPEDVEVLSLVGTKYAHILRPTLSSIYIGMEEVGRRAMFMLTDLIKGSLINKSYKFEGAYEKRSSTLN